MSPPNRAAIPRSLRSRVAFVPRAALRPALLTALVLLLGACSTAAPAVPVATATTSATASAAAGVPGWWRPPVEVTWQWQLQGEPDLTHDVDLYDLDLFDTPAETIDRLHAAGQRVVCYFSAGSVEDWRPDAGRFAAEEIGQPLGDWEGERWLDIRSPRVREILLARLDLAAEKGCDGVEPDNVQGYLEETGFDLTADEQLDFNRFLAEESHARGLAAGLKNDGPQAAALAEVFDFALNEECHAFGECADYAPFIEAGKPVLNAEYQDSLAEAEEAARTVCPAARAARLSTVILPLALDGAFRVACEE